MNPIRLAYGSLHHDGAGVLPSQTDGLDFLLLDGGPVLSSDRSATQALVEEAFERLGRSFYLDAELSVLASLAGRDPRLVAKGIAEQLAAAENRDLPLGVVRGCDVTDRLEEFLADGELAHQETGQPLLELRGPILQAVVSLGRDTLAEALDQHARVVLVGHAAGGRSCRRRGLRATSAPRPIASGLRSRPPDSGSCWHR